MRWLVRSSIGRWVFVALGLPLLAWLLRRTGEVFQSRTGGRSRVGGTLQQAGSWVDRTRGRARR